MGYAPISTILDAIALSAKDRVDIQKIVTESSIINNGRNGRMCAAVVREPKTNESEEHHSFNERRKQRE